MMRMSSSRPDLLLKGTVKYDVNVIRPCHCVVVQGQEGRLE